MYELRQVDHLRRYARIRDNGNRAYEVACPERGEVGGQIARADANALALLYAVRVPIDARRFEDKARQLRVGPALALEHYVFAVLVCVHGPEPESTEGWPEIFVHTLETAVDENCFEFVGHTGRAQDCVGYLPRTSGRLLYLNTNVYHSPSARVRLGIHGMAAGVVDMGIRDRDVSGRMLRRHIDSFYRFAAT